MKIPRIYTGNDGQAHIEEIDVDSFPNPQSLTEITGLQFRVQQPGRLPTGTWSPDATTSSPFRGR